VTPAGRLPLFLGRALPVIANAMFVAAFSLLVSGFILGIDVPVSAWPAIALVIFVSTFSCTGLGLICAGSGSASARRPCSTTSSSGCS
jgi:ABC-2 type transport system permease protein